VLAAQLGVSPQQKGTTLMKSWYLSALFLGLCSCASTGNAPNTWAPEEADIRKQLQLSMDGWNSGSLEQHLAFYDPAVTQMTVNGPQPGIDSIRRSFSNSYFKSGRPEQQLSTEQVVVRRLGHKSVLVTGKFLLSGGDKPTQSGWFTLVWVRTAQGWRVIHDHSS